MRVESFIVSKTKSIQKSQEYQNFQREKKNIKLQNEQTTTNQSTSNNYQKLIHITQTPPEIVKNLNAE